MKKFIITADTTCDLSAEIIKDRGFRLIPISVILGTDEYKDGTEIKPDKIFEYVKKTGELPKTAALTEEEYVNFFENVKKDCEAIIHFSISSKASVTFSNATKAAEQVGGVYCVDTMSLSTGEALLMLKADDMLKDGKSAEETFSAVKALRDKVQASFVVDALDYLYKGGRCSSTALVGSKLLKIHPHVYEKDGALAVKKKYLGVLNRCLSQYVGDLASEYADYDDERCFVTHSPCDDRTLIDAVIEKVKKLFRFKTIYETEAGATVTSHCGKNTIGVLFISK